MIAPSGPGAYTVQPAEQGCGLFLIQAGNPNVWPVQGPVQAKVGDQVVFGTPQGPRFEIQQEGAAAKPTASAPPPGPGFGGPTGSALAAEMQRQSTARLVTKVPFFRELYKLQHKVQTGSFANPYTIVTALFAVVGVIAAGGVTCSGLLVAVWQVLTR
jgi:hypothetical protein